jgi:hypothetical protein
MVQVITPNAALAPSVAPGGHRYASLARKNAAPPARRKLPAYGKALLDARRGGWHPHAVSLIYGNNWRGEAPDQAPLCIKPEEFELDLYDWRLVAGLHVTVVDQDGWLGGDWDRTTEPHQYGKFYFLLRELADAHAYVTVRCGAVTADVDEIAVTCRWFDGKRMCWPAWWSDALHQMHRAAVSGWANDGAALLERSREHSQ